MPALILERHLCADRSGDYEIEYKSVQLGDPESGCNHQWTAPAILWTTAWRGELNATANVAGSFTYNTAAGTVCLPFPYIECRLVPNDPANYESAGASVPLVVRRRHRDCMGYSGSIIYGTPLGAGNKRKRQCGGFVTYNAGRGNHPAAGSIH